MAVYNIAESIGFVIRRIANPIVIAIAAGIIAPIIAASFLGKNIWTFAALFGLEGRLPYLIRISHKCIADKNVLFRSIAEIKPDVVGSNNVSFESILICLLN